MPNVTNASAIKSAIEYLAKTDFVTEYPEVFAKLQHIDEVNAKNRKTPSITPDVISQTEAWVFEQPYAMTAKEVSEHFGWTVQRASMTLRATGLSSSEVHNGKNKVKVYGTDEQVQAAKDHYLEVCQAKAAERAARGAARK